MEPFLGQICAFGFGFAPRGWALCAGQVMSISQSTALFALLGTTYGGNGQTTFGLPDLRGRVPLGQGNGPGLTPRILGQMSGFEANTLLLSQLPAHTHAATAQSTSTSTSTSTIYAENIPGTAALPANKMLAGGGSTSLYTPPTAADNKPLSSEAIVTTTNTTTNTTVQVAAAGGSQPFDNMQPYLCLNYCIATEGIFPSRN